MPWAESVMSDRIQPVGKTADSSTILVLRETRAEQVSRSQDSLNWEGDLVDTSREKSWSLSYIERDHATTMTLNARRLEQEPDATLSFVDPVFKQACRCDVAGLITQVVSGPHT